MNRIEHNVETGEILEVALTQAEIADRETEALATAWIMLRNERNGLLSASDWTVLSDSPTSTAAWKTYRQALRDLPSTTNDPHQVVWPTQPA